jgi:WD40 repeat protein
MSSQAKSSRAARKDVSPRSRSSPSTFDLRFCISPDNRWLVTGSDDKTARLWLLQLNDLINLAQVTVRRNFSTDEWRLYFPGEKYRKTFPDLPGPKD